MARLELRVFGLPMTLEIPAERADTLREQWSWCLPGSVAQRSIPAIGGGDVEMTDDEPVRRLDLDDDPDGHGADYRLTTAVTARAITACSGTFFMFHAAGLADRRTGRVAGLVAASGTGKTTAVRVLCSTRGFGYVTDETLVLNDVGAVLPYPKPLSVVIDESFGGKSQHGPDELGFAPPPAGELSLGPLVVLHRVPDAPAPRLERLSTIEGLLAVLPQSSAVPLIPACLDGIASLARRGGGFWQLTYSEIAQSGPLLAEAFAAPPAAQDWEHVPGNWPTGSDAPSRYGARPSATGTTGTRSSAVQSTAEFERGFFVDAVVCPDSPEGLVLVGDQPMHLRGLGAQIWSDLDEPRDLAELLTRCLEAFGPHPDADHLVHAAIGELEEGGLIVRTRSAAAAAYRAGR